MVTYADELFDQLIASLLKEYLEFSPATGTYLGLHEYDSMMPNLSREAMEYIIKRLEWYYGKFKEIDREKLTGFRKIDYEPIVKTLEQSLITLRDWPTWKMYPMGFDAVGEALYLLLIKDHLPLQHRLISLYHRVRAVEKVLMDSIDAVEEPYSLWIDYALMTAKALPGLLNVIKSFGEKHGFTELSDACDRAVDAIKKAIERTEELKNRAKPGFKPIGRELFEKLLRTRFIEEDIETLRKWGYAEAERYRKLMEETARELGASSIEEALAKIKEKHLRSREEVFKFYRETVEKVRKFIAENSVVELPPMERIEIIETPEFVRHVIPFAAYMGPEIFSWSYTGYFLVTPPATDEMLKHHNIYDILNTVVHEAYPGHHVQITYTKLVPYITRKVLISSVELVEGWAHYCEELMLELGIDKSPEYRLKVYHDALWRAVRVYLDIELNTGMITFEQAVEKLIKDAYLPREGAYAEALRYTLTPSAQISYSYGKSKILRLREKVRELLGHRYSHSLFHRWILEEGILPLKILEEIVLEKARRYLAQQQ